MLRSHYAQADSSVNCHCSLITVNSSTPHLLTQPLLAMPDKKDKISISQSCLRLKKQRLPPRDPTQRSHVPVDYQEKQKQKIRRTKASSSSTFNCDSGVKSKRPMEDSESNIIYFDQVTESIVQAPKQDSDPSFSVSDQKQIILAQDRKYPRSSCQESSFKKRKRKSSPSSRFGQPTPTRSSLAEQRKVSEFLLPARSSFAHHTRESKRISSRQNRNSAKFQKIAYKNTQSVVSRSSNSDSINENSSLVTLNSSLIRELYKTFKMLHYRDDECQQP